VETVAAQVLGPDAVCVLGGAGQELSQA
jgi:hypothetical protein